MYFEKHYILIPLFKPTIVIVYYSSHMDASNKNYCWNPDKDPGGPWCYLESKGWGHCDVPMCDDTDDSEIFFCYYY